MTELYLIRHARAAEQSTHDWERPLVAEGRRDARAVGAALAKQRVRFDTVGCSPLVRAVETATLMCVETGYDGGLTIDNALTPDGPPSAMIEVAAQLPGEVVALVGHEPSMGQLLSVLTGRPGMSVVKCAVMKLRVGRMLAPGSCTLEWSISPRRLTPG